MENHFLHVVLMSVITLASLSILSAQAEENMKVSFVSPAWDGKTIPDGQQCNRFGGKGATPALNVSGIPEGTTSIIMEYSDQDYPALDNGGHGKIGYQLSGDQKNIVIPSIQGHSFDLNAPFIIIAPHRDIGWDTESAYLPPCSGGEKHLYYVTIKAMNNDSVLFEVKLEMGKN